MPKVGIASQQERGAAPRVGDDAVSSRLYAGKPGEFPTTRRPNLDGSDNVRDAEDQQERLLYLGKAPGTERILRDHTPTISLFFR